MNYLLHNSIQIYIFMIKHTNILNLYYNHIHIYSLIYPSYIIHLYVFHINYNSLVHKEMLLFHYLYLLLMINDAFKNLHEYLHKSIKDLLNFHKVELIINDNDTDFLDILILLFKVMDPNNILNSFIRMDINYLNCMVFIMIFLL